jgi:site-specific DNA recombinase
MKTANIQTALETLTRNRYQDSSKKRGGDGVIYTRVSSQEQAQNNGSLEVQNKYCNNYAATHSISIKEYFGGTYESAKTDGRKEFQRMLEYVKKHKNISYIIVFNYDRFSRSGAAASHLSEELSKQGITVKSVTQDIDTSTAIGRLQENFFHMLNNFDNRLKSDRTTINTREVMLKGYWPYATPMGYKNLKPKHRACFHEYVITEEGKHLKRGFQMVADGKCQFKEVVEYLSRRGVRITKTSFRHVFSNPFYAGYVTGKLVGGKLIKGQHPALVDIKTFMKVQDILNENPIAGVPKVSRHDEVPLKTFAKDEVSKMPFTGYKTKGNWYYKIKEGKHPVNVSAKNLNSLFVTLLSGFEYNPNQRTKIVNAIMKQLRERLFESSRDVMLTKKKITEKKALLEKIEHKFITDQISEDIYQKHSSKIREEIAALSKETDATQMIGSNLNNTVEKCMFIAQNLSQAWITSEYETKQQLQKLVFPEGILYNKQKGVVRTSKVNSLFDAITLLASDTRKNKKADSVKNRLQSNKVPKTGFEPARRFQRYHLKVVRLPISPPGPTPLEKGKQI